MKATYTKKAKPTLVGQTFRTFQKTPAGNQMLLKKVVSERWEDGTRMYDVQVDADPEMVPVLADMYDKLFLKEVIGVANYKGKVSGNVGNQMPSPFRNK